MPELPPPAPTGLSATPYYEVALNVKWNSVPEVHNYKLERCEVCTIVSEPPVASLCSWPWYWEEVYSRVDTSFIDRNVTLGIAYRYRVAANNAFGESEPSEEIGVVYW